jgi:predicted RNA binding protein YcfA (HicA-like mRNA interferase family)
MRQNPKSIRFDELSNFLESLGFRKRESGSHFTFTYPGSRNIITVPRRIPFVLPIYVKNILDVLDELGLTASVASEETGEIDEDSDNT